MLAHHALCREALLEAGSDFCGLERVEPFHSIRRLGHTFDDEAGHAIFDNLGHRCFPVGDDRYAASHRLDHDKTEGFWPLNGKDNCGGLVQKIGFLVLAYLAHQFDLLTVDVMRDAFVVKVPVGPVDTCGDLELPSRLSRYFDRIEQAFLRTNSPNESEIALSRRLLPMCRILIERIAMMNGCCPICPGKTRSLSVRYGDKRESRE